MRQTAMITLGSIAESSRASLSGILLAILFFVYLIPASLYGHYTRGPIPVNSPTINAGEEVWESWSFNTVTVATAEIAYVNQRAVPVADLAKHLTDLRQANSSRPLELRAHRGLQLSQIEPALRQMREAGYDSFWLLSDYKAPIEFIARPAPPD